jgi:ParB-like chromosome segregation protein Spo0J
MNYELHPLCTLFPRMGGAEYEALKRDIATNGLSQPIIIHEGMILDGGNRYRACQEIGVEPLVAQFEGDNIVAFVLSANLHRRHMSAGQQAAIVSSAQDWAKAQTVGKPKSGSVTGLEKDTVATRQAQSGASDKTQRMADQVAKANPELAKKVAHGEISLPKAHEQIAPKVEAPKQEATKPADGEPEYSELDAANDQIADLQDALALATMGQVSEEDKLQAKNLIAELRAHIKTLEATLKAVKVSRDTLQAENAQLVKQIKRQRRELDRLTGQRT